MIVDVQNDFISGSLALHSCPANHRGNDLLFNRSISSSKMNIPGEEVVPVINQIIRDVRFNVIAYTYDWHPFDHISFYENRHMRKTAPESPVCSSRQRINDFEKFFVDQCR